MSPIASGDTSGDMSAMNENNGHQRPEKVFRIGGVSASVFVREITGDNGTSPQFGPLAPLGRVRRETQATTVWHSLYAKPIASGVSMMPRKARRTLNVYQPCIRSQINQGFLYVQPAKPKNSPSMG
jgi:hypothetical protein